MSKDGGPAFPLVYDSTHTDGCIKHNGADGMSLRDYFAARAMELHIQRDISFRVDGRAFDRSAQDCYKFADAMLAARGDK